MQMKYRPLAFLLVLLLSSSLCPARVLAQKPDDCEPDPCPCAWGGIEALLWQRVPRFGDQPVAIDVETQATLLSTRDTGDDFHPGLRAVIGKRFVAGCWGAELVYMSLCDATGSASVMAAAAPSGELMIPGELGLSSNVFFGADGIRYDYSSSLYGAEVNFVRCCGSYECCEGKKGGKEQTGGAAHTLEPFIGFRYLRWKDQLGLYGQREEQGGTETGVYRVSAGNNLFGGQVGVKARRFGERLGWEAIGKAGVFGNEATQSQFAVDYPEFLIRPEVAESAGNLAFVGELTFSVIYKLTEVWAAKAGYNLMWIEGVALAPDQLDFTFTATSGTGLDDGGGVLLHGANVGLEARW